MRIAGVESVAVDVGGVGMEFEDIAAFWWLVG